ncbi:MAG: YggS family pyridoxal phosphate-dependent enzyme [Defluviitaleaceae bacterium]|nr:YggS family pyridoxal phosphate-dependent enzyme [Defluviitaleaceae bacterium]
MSLEKNILEIKENMATAAIKSARNLDDITLIAVTKTIDHSFLLYNINTFIENGITNFGENRVQELVEKHPHISSQINWHMIGTLQRNKVKYLPGKVVMIHSLDSLKLAQEISKTGEKAGMSFDVLIEINIGGEDSKHGIHPKDMLQLAVDAAALPNINIKGLMTIAPYVSDPNKNRDHFKRMHELYCQLGSVRA